MFFNSMAGDTSVHFNNYYVGVNPSTEILLQNILTLGVHNSIYES